MRIDHGPVQAMQVHHPPTPGDVPGAGKNVHAKDNYRLLQAESDDSSQNNREMCPLRLGTKVDGFERKGQQWCVLPNHKASFFCLSILQTPVELLMSGSRSLLHPFVCVRIDS